MAPSGPVCVRANRNMDSQPVRQGSDSRRQRAMQLCYLCASLNPALAGLPQLMEYLWNYMSMQRRSA